ncbi:MAG TPA: DNA mismatch repair endonuclease MutL [Candidatus Bipolaricaulota bacterium]|nr:DNA mismatch repair endonuclease MutL [Candidatus Bipolaricaulota bacterium]
MGNIKVLPQEIINQIAAGEVVERPASVVKELVENSLDAGADQIEIEIKNGGLNLIKVSDNGHGMSEEEAKLCVLQHATSKLKNIDDLFNINSFGFRGEALASVAAVGKFTLQTKDSDSISGSKISNSTGQIIVSSVGCPHGTSVFVEELFYNVPARKKYLKTVNTEFNHILELFTRFALIHGKVSWKLINNGKVAYHLPKTEKWLDRIELLLGDNLAADLLGVRVNLLDMECLGYIGKPQAALPHRRHQYLFVNKRPVTEHIVAKSVRDAYGTLLPRELNPVFILNLKIDPYKIDVNVHPRKLEVRFSEPQTVYRGVYRAIASTLDKNNLIKQVAFDKPAEERGSGFIDIKSALSEKKISLPPSASQVKQAVEFNQSIYALPKSAKKSFTSENIELVSFLQEKIELVDVDIDENDWQVIGQIKNSYIIIESASGVKIMDQHAVSERVQFEKIKLEFETEKIKSQSLLLPLLFDLPAIDMDNIRQSIDSWSKFGFSIDIFGEKTIKINAVPAMLKDKNIQKIFFEIFADIDERAVSSEFSDSARKVLNTMACRSAVKFGDDLSFEEIEILIKNFRALENHYTCVHGRPAIIDINYTELEKLFSRK